ncbi:MAG: phospholipid carrier-dependent glycosyltransferase [Bacteroidota bacterium]
MSGKKQPIKPTQSQPPIEKKVVKAPAKFNADTNPVWKKVFWITVITCALIMLISGWGTGYHSDEMDQNAYGKAVTQFYLSGGKDTSFLHLKLPDGEMVAEQIKTYGGLFDVIVNGITGVLNLKYEYDVRHFIIQLVSLLSMLLASLIVLKLTGGYKSALITFILIFLTPTYFGHSLMNSRDIPFAFGYVLGLYMLIRFFQEFKPGNYKITLLLALAIGISMSVRIGGIILYGVMGVMFVVMCLTDNTWLNYLKATRNYAKYALHIVILTVVPYSIAVFSHPFIWSAPIDNFIFCINTAKKFPNKIPLAFKGEIYNSLTIPDDYLTTWLGITIPVAVFVFFSIGLLFLIVFRKRIRHMNYLLMIAFAGVFPILYAKFNSFALYTGWRHLLFVYPALVVIAGCWFEYITIKSKWLNYLMPLGVVLCFSHPIYWMSKNHPYEYLYFNETSDGFAKNYYLYETDGWQLSVKKAVEWIREQDNFKNNPRNIICTNSYSPVRSLILDKYGDTATKVVYGGYNARNTKNWNYMIFNVNLLPPWYLKNNYPPSKTIKTIDVDGKPICAILYDNVRNDYFGLMSVSKKEYRLADSLLSLYYKEDSVTEVIIEGYATCKAEAGDWDGSYRLCKRGISLYPNNMTMYYISAMYCARKERYNEAIDYLHTAISVGYPLNKTVYEKLSQLYYLNGDEATAEKYYQEWLKAKE